MFFNLFFFALFSKINGIDSIEKIPLVINTWGFENATLKAWNTLQFSGSAIDAVVAGCSLCEREQCDGTVGYGGSPDENGETTLDAMIIDGMSMNIGAVAALRNVKDAIAVARHVLENTKHTMLVGEQASEFAFQMGFKQESLSTLKSKRMYLNWKQNNCQPNFWTNVIPRPSESCGPYDPYDDISPGIDDIKSVKFNYRNHDTIGMIVIDADGNIFAGTSTNGAAYKIPGRVGDSPIPGSGAYADGKVGAAAATGDGDILMRFLPSFLTVENIRNGDSPSIASLKSLQRIAEFYPNFMGAIVATDKNGNYGAACHGIPKFPYSIRNPVSGRVVIEEVECFK